MDGHPNPDPGVSADVDTYRRIVEAVPEGIWIVDPQGRTLFSNGRMAEILGVDLATMSGQSCFTYVFPEDAAAAQRHFVRILAGDPRPFDFRLRRADGSPIWVGISWRPTYDIRGSPAALLGLCSDISERKRAENDLRKNEELFRTLADTAPVITWMSGPDKMATYYNARALSFAGIEMDEAIGIGYQQFLHPEDREQYIKTIFEAADMRVPFSTEARYRRADGEYRWILVTGVPRVMNGVYLGHVGTGIDVTELRRSYDFHLASQKLQSLGMLAAGVAHDFNNLLSAIVTHAESAQGDIDPSSPAAEDVNYIHRIALRASEIVSQLLLFAHQEAAPSMNIDLSRVVAEMLDLIKVSIAKTAVLETDLAADLPAIRASAPEMRQVVMNLIINASESLLGQPGSITIRTASVPREGQQAAAVRLEVQDTGCGMTDDVKARIFDPFFTTRLAGRGLGLAAVDGIVRRHGGSIEAESTPGEGSRFIIVLPCAAANLSASAAP